MDSISPIPICSRGELADIRLPQQSPHPIVFLIPSWFPVNSEAELTTLSTDEQSTLTRYQTQRRQRQFFLGRFCLRHVLARWLEIPAAAIPLEQERFGKVVLGRDYAHRSLYFNISHSRDYTVIALNQKSDVGIDIEFVDTEMKLSVIAEFIMDTTEYSQWQQQEQEKQISTFYDHWTKHEAYLKLTGLGFHRLPPDRCRSVHFKKLLLPEHYAGALAFWHVDP
ncbi:MAG: 4'-phosphopantetheinyl transferase superfamily protein [Planctomyces sp.]|nr:4'-phosphopantetheinyl transferase superfamily protein [Planctomyces sp.]